MVASAVPTFRGVCVFSARYACTQDPLKLRVPVQQFSLDFPDSSLHPLPYSLFPVMNKKFKVMGYHTALKNAAFYSQVLSHVSFNPYFAL